jgi:hypothetical protein
MAVLDRHGRLFGKFSILDIGAILIVIVALFGIFITPSGSNSPTAKTSPIEADLIVRGLNVLQPQKLLTEFKAGSKLSFVIRNQPAGDVEIKGVKSLERSIAVPQPDGSLKALPDPRPDSYSTDMLITIAGKGQVTPQGIVLGNTKFKIGTPVEIDHKNYSFNATVVDIRTN